MVRPLVGDVRSVLTPPTRCCRSHTRPLSLTCLVFCTPSSLLQGVVDLETIEPPVDLEGDLSWQNPVWSRAKDTELVSFLNGKADEAKVAADRLFHTQLKCVLPLFFCAEIVH